MGGQLSVASTTLLENIVVRATSWAVGACVGAAAALLSRVAEDGHRVVPRADLWIAAEDVAEDEEKLDMMLDQDDAVGAAGDGAAVGDAAAMASAPAPLLATGAAAAGAAGDDPGQSFASLCETVIAKAVIAIDLNSVASNSAADVVMLRRWAASRCPAGAPKYKAPALPAPPQPPRPALPAPPPRPPPAGRPASSSSWSWSEGEWQGWWGRRPQ